MIRPKNLVNDGFYQTKPKEDQSTGQINRSVLVIGAARSATSMIAGALYHLGYYAGEQASAPVFEDMKLRNAVESHSWNEARHLSNGYSRSHEHWFFKWTVPARPVSIFGRLRQIILRRPSEADKLCALYRSMERPKVIITFKDVFSISNRNRISISSDILDGIRGALAAYEAVRRFLLRESPNALMIASDKALNNKEHLLEQLIHFCDLNPTDAQKQAALNFIEPNPWRYLVSTKSDLCLGHVDTIQNGVVKGWAKYKNSDQAACVVLSVDDVEVSKTSANRFRTDLLQAGHREGNCAFCFDNLDPTSLNPGATVRVKVEGDSQDLSNSPQVVGSDNLT